MELPDNSVSVVEMLQSMDNGRLLEKLYFEIVRVMDEVKVINDPKKAGKVTLEIPISLLVRDEPALILGAGLKTTLPSKKGGAKVFFVGSGDGLIYKQDPRQPALPFRLVEKENSDVRRVESPAAVKEVN